MHKPHLATFTYHSNFILTRVILGAVWLPKKNLAIQKQSATFHWFTPYINFMFLNKSM